MEGLTEYDISQMIGCSQRHVRRLKNEGKLRIYRIGKVIRYLREDVVDYMEGDLDKALFIPYKEAADRAGVTVQTIYYGVKQSSFRFKIQPKGKPKALVYWPDVEEMYVSCTLDTQSRMSPELEELLGIQNFE